MQIEAARQLVRHAASLRDAGVVRSQLGPSGGYWLRRPADDPTVSADERERPGTIGRSTR